MSPPDRCRPAALMRTQATPCSRDLLFRTFTSVEFKVDLFDAFDGWPVQPPAVLRWLVGRKLISDEANGPLCPWYLLAGREAFRTADQWPSTFPGHDLLCVMRCQCDDDIACVDLASENRNAIVVIHGWTSTGFEILERFDSGWDWLVSVVRDWEEMAPGENF